MQYRVAFDLAQTGFKEENFSFLLPGIILVGLGIGFVIFRDHLTSPERRQPMPRTFPVVFLVFGVLWTLVSAGTLYMHYREAYNALLEHRFSIAEGEVIEFQPMPFTGHASERFCVSDSEACFTYSDYVATPGFNKTSTHGGPIREKVPVRVSYINNTILRLEVGE